MLLKHVYLYLNAEEYPSELATEFGFWTRYICNFLERRLKALKFQADGFNKICIQGRHKPENSCPIVSENAALPTVFFDQELFRNLSRSECHEFFIQMLLDGLRKCSQFHDVPLVELVAAIEEFRQGGYKNEWVHQAKSFSKIGLRASLLCSLNMERFELDLQVERKGEVLAIRKILETKPDEIIFQHKFKELILVGNDLVVKDRFNEVIFSFDLSAAL